MRPGRPLLQLLALLAMSAAVAAQESRPQGMGTDFLPDVGDSGEAAPEAPDPASAASGEGGEGTEETPSAAVLPDRPEPRTAQGAESADPDDGTPDDGGGASPDASIIPEPPQRQAPLVMLSELWRQAVAAGRTDSGFETWLERELGMRRSPAAPAPSGDQAGRTRAVAAEWDRRAGPVALGAAGRVVTTFGAAIPQALCSPLTVCYIELEPGEELTDTPSWGDTARWQVVAKVQGRGPETVVLEVKPAEDAGHTNLVIPTDRRLYTISLVNDPDVHTPILSFRYPDSAARAAAAAIEERRKRDAQAAEAEQVAAAVARAARQARLEREGLPTATGPRLVEDLDFGFRIEGKAPFRPVRVFADGRRTYIDLHPRYRGTLPAIIPGPDEENRALNTRVTDEGRRLVADRVITDVWLQAGRQRVRVRREVRR